MLFRSYQNKLFNSCFNLIGGVRFVYRDELFENLKTPTLPYQLGGYDLYQNATKKQFKYLSEETGLDVLYSVDNQQSEKLPTSDENQYKVFYAVLKAKLPSEIMQVYTKNKHFFKTVQLVIALARLSDLPSMAVHGTKKPEAGQLLLKDSEEVRSKFLKQLFNAKDFDLGCKVAVFYSLAKLDKVHQPVEQFDQLGRQISKSFEDLPMTHQGMFSVCLPSLNGQNIDKLTDDVIGSIERKITNRLFIPGELRPRFMANTIHTVAKNGKYFEYQRLVNSLVAQVSRFKDYPMIFSPKTLALMLEGLGMLTYDVTYAMQQEFIKSVIVHKSRFHDDQLSQVIYGMGRLGFLNASIIEQLSVELESAIQRFNGLELFRCLKGMEEGGLTPEVELRQKLVDRFSFLRKNKQVFGLNAVEMVRAFRLLGLSKEECMQIMYDMGAEQNLIGKIGDITDFERRLVRAKV
eukprot:TRINITY_DN4690_c0_g1_i6.p1 TRINITY_DN4690_c0_g1~~TRINITY_DN4690_c0_g1_i6.p1  ORF type:complete len:495 (-),score=48.94 TRINITY_DN4690_c0_g1_i6:571-1956(-)